MTPELVRSRFEEWARRLMGDGVARGFDIEGQDGLRLVLHRKTDGEVAAVEMTGTTEVFVLRLGPLYKVHETAYEAVDKWEVLEEFLTDATLFLANDYVEELCIRKGQVISRSIRLSGEDGRVIASRVSPLNRVRRALGCEQVVLRPQSTPSDDTEAI